MKRIPLSPAHARRFIAAVGILGVGGMLSGCGNRGGAEGAPGMAPEVAVVVMRPERITVTTELAGRASAFLVAEVRPQVSGILQKRLF
jgi:membrane fusion protein (multidrug efflux system)